MNKEQLFEWRTLNGFTSYEMAQLIGVSVSTYSNIESGVCAPSKKSRFLISKWVAQYVDLQEFLPDLPVSEECATVEGVGPDAPRTVNAIGGSQSHSPYRMELLDPKALLATSKVLAEGADKYGANNWRLISIEDHLNHALVHIYAYLAGDKSDEHLSHTVCRALFALGVDLQSDEDIHKVLLDKQAKGEG